MLKVLGIKHPYVILQLRPIVYFNNWIFCYNFPRDAKFVRDNLKITFNFNINISCINYSI